MTNKLLYALIESGGNPNKFSSNASLAKDFEMTDLDFQLFLYYLEIYFNIDIDEGDIQLSDNLDYVTKYLEFKTLNVA